MMIRKYLLCAALSAVMLTSGCSIFNDPNDPRTLKNDGNPQVILLQADRRAIFTFENGKNGKVCPEPSPDVRADVESTIKTLLSGSATVPQGITAEGKAELEATCRMITAALLKRSQGLQVLRDLSFQACLANMRGDLTGEAYTNFVTNVIPQLTISLITTEFLSSMTTNGVSLPKDVVEALTKYLILSTARP